MRPAPHEHDSGKISGFSNVRQRHTGRHPDAVAGAILDGLSCAAKVLRQFRVASSQHPKFAGRAFEQIITAAVEPAFGIDDEPASILRPSRNLEHVVLERGCNSLARSLDL